MRRNLLPRYTLLTLGYAGIILLSALAAIILRFEGAIPGPEGAEMARLVPAFALLSLTGYLIAGLFHGLWRYASTVTLFQVFKGVTLSALALLLLLLGRPGTPLTLGFIVIVWLCQFGLLAGARIGWRLWREGAGAALDAAFAGLEPAGAATGGAAERALVVGAGPPGVHLVQQMQRGPAGRRRFVPAGFVDPDPRLTGKLIEGVAVLGTIADLPRLLESKHADAVIVSSPDLPGPLAREIVRFCERAGVRVRVLPGLSDPGAPGAALGARASLARLRDMRIEDLLGRPPAHIDLGEVRGFLRGQRVLVTGAAGSIGGELARQAAGFAPAALGLLDHAENGLYYLHHELLARHPGIPADAIVADLQDPQGLEEAMLRFRPTVVFHAAAHKHVPLLEANPREAVLNNVVGTRNLIEAAERHAVAGFVLISTDKAVQPSSIMGASKRLCEMLLQARARRSRTRFVAVRFGNVLGSEGSVIPLFQRQLERGGPITVTHPEARRYFMTESEAARLVLQAGAMGRGGEVFVLEMGEQVRIVDLARQLVRMAGLREGEDVEIVFTGLRPGEKLNEELLSASERARTTRHERILVWEQEQVDEVQLLSGVRSLEQAARRGDAAAIRAHLHALVADFREVAPPGREPVPVAQRMDPSEAATMPAQPAPVFGPQAAAGTSAAKRAEPPAPRDTEPPTLRPLGDAVIASALLGLSLPIWLLVWLEARAGGRQEWLRHRVCVGRSRRWGGRREVWIEAEREPAPAVPIERRSAERRSVDLMGTPIRCTRFRSDLGPVSRWLARRGLDRLPMLGNVIRGEMALVGPSPVPQGVVTRWFHLVPGVELRFSVLPGLAGLAQLSKDSDADTGGMVRRAALDLEYVTRRSAWTDVAILARTLGRVLLPPRGFDATRVEGGWDEERASTNGPHAAGELPADDAESAWSAPRSASADPGAAPRSRPRRA